MPLPGLRWGEEGEARLRIGRGGARGKRGPAEGRHPQAEGAGVADIRASAQGHGQGRWRHGAKHAGARGGGGVWACLLRVMLYVV